MNCSIPRLLFAGACRMRMGIRLSRLAIEWREALGIGHLATGEGGFLDAQTESGNAVAGLAISYSMS